MKMQQLVALKAVVECGSFQAGAKHLNKTHPSLITAIKNLEYELGVTLFDRSHYRATLSEEGKLLYQRSLRVLEEAEMLTAQAHHMAAGDETALNIVVGDITPYGVILPLLRIFTQQYPQTQVNLMFENLSGPVEKLLAGEADLVFHHADKTDLRFERNNLTAVDLIPVVAPGFLGGLDRLRADGSLRYQQLATFTQCVIRDTGAGHEKNSYHLLDKAAKITVGDQHTKKQVIAGGLGWGHMPLFMIADELATGALVSLEGQHITRHKMEIAVMRRAGQPVGRMAQIVWALFSE